MNWRVALIAICIPFLTGCEKLLKNMLMGQNGNRQSQAQQNNTPHSIAFLGWGQSNMLGLTEGGQPWNQWPSMDQLKIYDEYMIGYGQPYQGYRRGPMYYMAYLYLQKYPAATVYIINCSDSGSRIDVWVPGGEFNTRCIDFVQTMLPPGVPIGAQFAVQGESEGLDPTPSPTWGMRFHSTAQSFSNRWNIPIFIYGQIGRLPPIPAPYWTDIQAQQASLSNDSMVMVRTDDLSMISDVIHFDINGTRDLGARFFRAYQGWLLGD